jgi:hypothetical protein
MHPQRLLLLLGAANVGVGAQQDVFQLGLLLVDVLDRLARVVALRARDIAGRERLGLGTRRLLGLRAEGLGRRARRGQRGGGGRGGVGRAAWARRALRRGAAAGAQRGAEAAQRQRSTSHGEGRGAAQRAAAPRGHGAAAPLQRGCRVRRPARDAARRRAPPGPPRRAARGAIGPWAHPSAPHAPWRPLGTGSSSRCRCNRSRSRCRRPWLLPAPAGRSDRLFEAFCARVRGRGAAGRQVGLSSCVRRRGRARAWSEAARVWNDVARRVSPHKPGAAAPRRPSEARRPRRVCCAAPPLRALCCAALRCAHPGRRPCAGQPPGPGPVRGGVRAAAARAAAARAAAAHATSPLGAAMPARCARFGRVRVRNAAAPAAARPSRRRRRYCAAALLAACRRPWAWSPTPTAHRPPSTAPAPAPAPLPPRAPAPAFPAPSPPGPALSGTASHPTTT